MNLNDYRSAFAKIAPSEAWKRETLEKMHALERAEAAAPRRKAVSFSAKLRRAALPVAAMLAIMLVPLSSLRGCGASGGSAGAPMARAGEEKSYDASFYGEMPDGNSMAPQDVGSTQETASAGVDAAPTEKGAPSFAGSGAPFPFYAGGGGMGAGGLLVKTPDAAELAGANPTLDLPAEALPAALPVYRTYTDADAIYGVLSDTAAKLGYTLAESREELRVEGVSPEALEAGAPWRAPAAFAEMDGMPVSFSACTVQWSLSGEDGAAAPAPAADAAPEAVLWHYYEHCGAKVQPMENPALEQTGDYTSDGTFLADAVFYEAGAADDSLETRLYNYTFRRVALAADSEDGSRLRAVRCTVPPEEIGVYALRTLDEARQTLESGGAWLAGAGAAGGYEGAAVRVLHWELTYHTDEFSDIVQPVYRFLIETPDSGAPQPESGDAAYRSVTYALVPALREEYLRTA